MKRLRTMHLLALSLGIFVAACSASPADLGDSAACDWPVEPLMTAPDTVALHQAPAAPFPSDLYSVPADTATGLRNHIQGQGLLFQNAVNRQDGWAPHGPIRLAFSGTIDPASLPATVTESTQPESPIQLIAMDGSFDRAPFEIRSGQDPTYVYLRPYLPLREETRYAIVVQKGLTPEVGQCMQRNTGLRAIARGEATTLPVHTHTAIHETYQSLAEHADTTGITARDILLAVPYTTQSISRSLIEKRADVVASPLAPLGMQAYYMLEDDGVTVNPAIPLPDLPTSVELGTDVSLEHISHVVQGTFPAADYRRDYRWVDHPQRTNELEFLITFPKLSSVLPEYREVLGDPVRFPVIIFGHGLTACKETLLGVASRFSRYGFAVAGIDVIEHGHRITDPYDTCGRSIAEGLRLIRFVELEIGRDNFRQTVLDEIQFIHMLASNPELDYLADAEDVTDSTGRLAVDQFGFIGQSLGAILGTMLTTVEPRITTAVLNVPGGGLTDFAILAEPDGEHPFDVELPDGLLYENLAGLQSILGPGDPLYYAAYAQKQAPPTAENHSPKNILLQQGMDDEIMPAYLTQNLGRALGSVLMTPFDQAVEGVDIADPPYRGEGPVTVAHQQYVVPEDPIVEGARSWNSHYLLIMANDPAIVAAAQYQSAHFLWTGLFEGKAEVIDGFTVAD